MAEKARVHAIDALARFRPALVEFVEQCQTALLSAEADVGRAVSRIRADRYPYWKKQIRVRQDELNRARSELAMKQAMREPDDARPDVEERKAVERARRRVREAEEKAAACQRWARRLEREAEHFRGQVSALKRVLEMDLPRAIAELDRMSGALEAYAKLGGKRPSGRAGDDEGQSGGPG